MLLLIFLTVQIKVSEAGELFWNPTANAARRIKLECLEEQPDGHFGLVPRHCWRQFSVDFLMGVLSDRFQETAVSFLDESVLKKILDELILQMNGSFSTTLSFATQRSSLEKLSGQKIQQVICHVLSIFPKLSV